MLSIKTKNVVMALIVGLVLTVAFVIANVNPFGDVTATDNLSPGTIYVDDDADPSWYDATHAKTIQEGIDNATAGDTVFVYNGTYYENVVVDKTINLTGENRNGTIIDGGGNGDVVYITADWVNISGFLVQTSKAGYSGVHTDSNCNNIKGNTIKSNNGYGVHLSHSSNNNIKDNTISNNSYGLRLFYSSNNNITDNTINSNNWDGIALLSSSNNNTILDNNISSNNNYGIHLFSSNSYNNTIVNNTISSNNHGIILSFSSNNTITDNTISNNHYGIYLSSSSNIIADNTITSNNWYGICLPSASNNNILGNTISNNHDGIYLFSSNSYNNTIVNNTISSNNNHGIILSFSSNNIFYHNNFINDTQNAYDDGNNTWDNGYPSGGNYWDDYTGSDANGNGIGDTPYNISGDSNQDKYPLMNPIISPPVFVWVDGNFNSSTPGWGYDHFDKIQDGINAVEENGTVYVFNGTYYENVVVDKSINLTGENRNNTIIDGGGSGDVAYVSADWVNITGFTIQNGGDGGAYSGIKVYNASNITIRDNAVINNSFIGILLSSSSNTTIFNNTIRNNSDGLYNGDGIRLGSSSNNIISGNIITNNNNNGIVLYSPSDNNTIRNNIIQDNGEYGIVLWSCDNNSIFDNKINNSGAGLFWGSGIYICSSHNNTVSDNIVTNSLIDGISLGYSSSNNIIRDNVIQYNHRWGVDLYDSCNNNIIDNNSIANTKKDGMRLYNSSNNTIIRNNIANNNWSGILLYSNSPDNFIYHNNFINNNPNALDYSTNTWDNGYPSGGNYWDDYNGTDTNGDGIGDTPYNISGGNNQDRYPWMNPWNITPVTTFVNISPSTQTVYPSETFTVNITIDPWEPIAGAQADLLFDPSLITVNSVTDGEMFDMWFNANLEIDNVNGAVRNISAIDLGSVTTPGVFAIIEFTAGSIDGTSPLNLTNVIVGDPNGTAVSIMVNNGNVTVIPYPDWDVNMDDSVNILDLIIVGQHWGETGTPGWIRADVNKDGVINILDLILIGQYWTG